MCVGADPRLVLAHVGEQRAPVDVADRVQPVRAADPQLVVDLEVAAGLDPDGLEPELVGARPATDRDQQLVAAQLRRRPRARSDTCPASPRVAAVALTPGPQLDPGALEPGADLLARERLLVGEHAIERPRPERRSSRGCSTPAPSRRRRRRRRGSAAARGPRSAVVASRFVHGRASREALDRRDRGRRCRWRHHRLRRAQTARRRRCTVRSPSSARAAADELDPACLEPRQHAGVVAVVDHLVAARRAPAPGRARPRPSRARPARARSRPAARPGAAAPSTACRRSTSTRRRSAPARRSPPAARRRRRARRRPRPPGRRRSRSRRTLARSSSSVSARPPALPTGADRVDRRDGREARQARELPLEALLRAHLRARRRAPAQAAAGGRRFVIQEHHARRLHWDFRLERDGVLVSWALPRGVPGDPDRNRLAVHTEDHPLDYIDFAGEIPKGEYGGGDGGDLGPRHLRGREVGGRARSSSASHGERVSGRYALFRTRGNDWMIHRMDPPVAGRAAARADRADARRARASGCRRDDDELGVRDRLARASGRSRSATPATWCSRARRRRPAAAVSGAVRDRARARAASRSRSTACSRCFGDDGAPSAERSSAASGARSDSEIRRRSRDTPGDPDRLRPPAPGPREPARAPATRSAASGSRRSASTARAGRRPAYHRGDGKAFRAAAAERGLAAIVAKRLAEPLPAGPVQPRLAPDARGGARRRRSSSRGRSRSTPTASAAARPR